MLGSTNPHPATPAQRSAPSTARRVIRPSIVTFAHRVIDVIAATGPSVAVYDDQLLLYDDLEVAQRARRQRVMLTRRHLHDRGRDQRLGVAVDGERAGSVEHVE